MLYPTIFWYFIQQCKCTVSSIENKSQRSHKHSGTIITQHIVSIFYIQVSHYKVVYWSITNFTINIIFHEWESNSLLQTPCKEKCKILIGWKMMAKLPGNRDKASFHWLFARAGHTRPARRWERRILATRPSGTCLQWCAICCQSLWKTIHYTVFFLRR